MGSCCTMTLKFSFAVIKTFIIDGIARHGILLYYHIEIQFSIIKTFIIVVIARQGVLLYYHIEIQFYCNQNVCYSCNCKAWVLTSITTLLFSSTLIKSFIVVAIARHGILLFYHIEIHLYCNHNSCYSCFCRVWDLTVLAH
jgi:hypothetical protein